MRKALSIESSQTINQLLTAAKMRDLTTMHVRHTIRRPIRPGASMSSTFDSRLRMNAADYFFVLCR